MLKIKQNTYKSYIIYVLKCGLILASCPITNMVSDFTNQYSGNFKNKKTGRWSDLAHLSHRELKELFFLECSKKCTVNY